VTKISVFMTSHNKNGWVQEAIQSVIDQKFYVAWELWLLENSTDTITRNSLRNDLALYDPKIHYVECDLTPEERASKFVAGYLLNKYYPQARGDIVLFLADDDLFMDKELFLKIDHYFKLHPDRQGLYFHMHRTYATAPGQGHSGPFYATIPAFSPRGQGQVDCQIDGGQVAIRKSVLDELDRKGIPYYGEDADPELNSHADGIHLETIARETGTVFHPLDADGLIHRTTPSSTWTKL
jgi:glycosyltransferase involved in cell wall biosynthesis